MCYIVAMDSLGWSCDRSMHAVRDYLIQLAAQTGGHPHAAGRIRCVTAEVARQDNDFDCGLFPPGNIARVGAADLSRLTSLLSGIEDGGLLARDASEDVFTTFTQADATEARRRMREHLRDTARDHSVPPRTPGWGLGTVYGPRQMAASLPYLAHMRHH